MIFIIEIAFDCNTNRSDVYILQSPPEVKADAFITQIRYIKTLDKIIKNSNMKAK